MKTPLRRLVTGLTLAAALAAAVAPPAAAADDERLTAARRLLRHTGTADSLALFPEPFLQNLETQRSGLDPEVYAALEEAAAEAYRPAALAADVERYLLDHWNPGAADRALDWYASPLGRRVLAVEAANRGPEAEQRLASYLEVIGRLPPVDERIGFAARLDRGTRASANLNRLAVALGYSLVEALAPLSANADEAAREVEAMGDELAAPLRRQTRLRILFVYRSLVLGDLSAYAEFVDSDAGRWLFGTLQAAWGEALDRAAERLRTDIAERLGEPVEGPS